MAKETFFLQNFNIISLSKWEGTIKSGKNAGNPYVKFVFTTDHPKAGNQEFQYFADPTASETWPYEGVAVKEMEGLLGTYQGKIQYDVKKILYGEVEKSEDRSPAPAGGPEPGRKPSDMRKDHPIWFCMAYTKDLQVARLIHLKASDPIPSLSELIDEVVTSGLLMYRDVVKDAGRVE